jgi:fatty acid desaturase
MLELECDMLNSSVDRPSFSSLTDPAFKKQLQVLRQTDNFRNWYYILRTYALIIGVVGGSVWCYHDARSRGLSAFWVAPVFAMAIIVMGALQHHLANMAHEAVHHTLFKNRWLNDMVSEWLCSFPLFSSTFHYGLHHLAHHQFVNDPARDPDISQLQKSGHRLTFPIIRAEFLEVLFHQMWLPNLVRYSMARAEYDSLGSVNNPYIRDDWEYTKLPSRISGAFLATLVLALAGIVMYGSAVQLALIPPALWAGYMVVLQLMPERWFYQSKIQPFVSVRTLAAMRTTFFTLAFSSIAWATFSTGDWWAAYLSLLWVAPLLTTFPLYMVLRQIVQHGNGDRGWMTNTRVFVCHPFINFAVFPMGQDYHLPHHMFSTIPHYRLKRLHALLEDIPEYRDQATVVEGYIWPKDQPQVRPTVVDVLGPQYAPQSFRDVYIDNSVLEGRNVNEREKDEILQEGAREAERVRKAAHVGSWSLRDEPDSSRSEVA